jgi:hypothetical protein
MATERIIPNGIPENEQSVLVNVRDSSGREFESTDDFINVIDDSDANTFAIFLGAFEFAQTYVTFTDPVDIQSADTINSVTLSVYTGIHKSFQATMRTGLYDEDGANGELYGNASLTNVPSTATWHSFSNTSTNWTIQLINELTAWVQVTEGSATINDIRLDIDYTPATSLAKPIQITSGLIQLTSGKISI